MAAKERLRIDNLLVMKELCQSRQIAQSLIIQGRVKVEGKVINKPGASVTKDSSILIEYEKDTYVSRGGIKLEHALKTFEINVENMVALDIGASTGGFTDCLLQYGASKVYAVDVGKGQLHYKLRNNSKVVNIERFNARYLEKETIAESIDIITIDVSFISLEKIMVPAKKHMKNNGFMLTLIKPQFEAGRNKVKKGVVKDSDVHLEVMLKVIHFAEQNGLYCVNMTYSPIKGPSGNIEFFFLWRNCISEKSELNVNKINELLSRTKNHFIKIYPGEEHEKNIAG